MSFSFNRCWMCGVIKHKSNLVYATIDVNYFFLCKNCANKINDFIYENSKVE